MYERFNNDNLNNDKDDIDSHDSDNCDDNDNNANADNDNGKYDDDQAHTTLARAVTTVCYLNTLYPVQGLKVNSYPVLCSGCQGVHAGPCAPVSVAITINHY